MSQNKILALLADERFVRWVKSDDPALKEYWSEWLREHPEFETEFKKAQQLIRSAHYQETYRLDESESSQILESIEGQLNVTNTHRSYLKYWIRGVAAVLILAFGVTYYINYNGKDQVADSGQSELVEKTAAIGSKVTITLSDGSTVKLNSGSKLSYHSPFGLENREVELDGEAFFEVTKDPDKPFIVRSNSLKTEVLGTSFNVRAYQDDGDLDVVLVTGLVKVDFFDEETRVEKILNPNEMISYSKATKEVKIGRVEPEAFICWKDQILNFSDESLPEVIHKLERWYGVKIMVKNPQNREWEYTGRFNKKSLEHVLLRMSFAEKFTYSINKDNVTIELK